MAKRGIAAVFTLPSGNKCTIENDGIVTINTNAKGIKGKYEKARVVGMDRMGEAVRVVLDGGGIAEIPIKTIVSIDDCKVGGFSCVEIK